MYWLKEFEHSVTLPPEFLVPGVSDLVQYRVHQQLQGTCTAQHGYLLAVLSALPTSPGQVLPGSSAVRFSVRVRALTAVPLKNEILDVLVQSVSKVGCFGQAGPVQVFVSNRLMPSEYKYEAGPPAMYRADDLGGLRIAAGERLRVRVIGTKLENGEIFAIGSIKEDYLGPI